MKYKVGDKVWVWRGDVAESPQEVVISAYSGKASFNEDVYEFKYFRDGIRLFQSGAGESDLYETEDAAKLARFKVVQTVEDIFNQIERIMVRNKESMIELKHKLYVEYSASR